VFVSLIGQFTTQISPAASSRNIGGDLEGFLLRESNML